MKQVPNASPGSDGCKPYELTGWGQISRSRAEVQRIASSDEAQLALGAARSRGASVIARGSGYSYGDPALNRDGVVLDMTAMNRVLSWNPGAGLIDVEPGVTVGQLCAHVERDNWWPPVLPGTQGPTIGGCIAANIHGKNNWRMGTIGDHVEEIDVLTAAGEIETCGPDTEPSLFRAIAGGFGLLGIVVRARLAMERSSGVLRVERTAAPGLEEIMGILDRWSPRADYMVGWIDGYAPREELGRGLTQIAFHHEGPDRGQTGGIAELPALNHLRANLWRTMRPLANDRVLKRINAAQYALGSMQSGRVDLVSRRRFDFFHDFVPHWNRAFAGGIIQFQIFVPMATAEDVFRKALESAGASGFFPFLAVLKRHRPDRFLLSEGVDGFSLSLDFAPGKRRTELTTLLGDLAESVVLPARGRFYLAKDSIMTSDQVRQSFGNDAVDEFLGLKARWDPESVFSSDMQRRLLDAS